MIVTPKVTTTNDVDSVAKQREEIKQLDRKKLEEKAEQKAEERKSGIDPRNAVKNENTGKKIDVTA